MYSRERVMRAQRRDGLPDRVPLQSDLYRPLPEALSEKLGIAIGWPRPERHDGLAAYAIDEQYLLPRGRPEEVDADVKAKIDALGAGGSYMMARAHVNQRDTPIESIESFIDSVPRHGVCA